MGDEEHWEWQRLPPELRSRILRLLPLRSAVACRSVCREWKESLASWSASATSSSSWFLVKQEQVQGGLEWAVIDAGSGELIRLAGYGHPAGSVAVGEGLVCFCTRSSARPEFYVGNPLLHGSLRKLPELPRSFGTVAMLLLNSLLPTRVLGMVRMDDDQNPSGCCSFKVLVSHGSSGSILLYESSRSAWRDVSPASDLVQQLLQEMDERVVPLQRKAELLWPSLRADRHLVGFDFARLAWMVVEAPIPEQLDAASLVEEPSSGSILLVGATKSRGSNHYRHLKVWRLWEGSGGWELVSRMQDHMLQEISPKGFFSACCAAADGGVMLLACTLEKFSAQLGDWAFKRLLLWFCDTQNARWSPNPCRRLLKDLDLKTAVVYPFQPRLDFHSSLLRVSQRTQQD